VSPGRKADRPAFVNIPATVKRSDPSVLENIVVAIVLGGFLIFSVWGLRVGAEQARRDGQAAKARGGRETAKGSGQSARD